MCSASLSPKVCDHETESISGTHGGTRLPELPVYRTTTITTTNPSAFSVRTQRLIPKTFINVCAAVPYDGAASGRKDGDGVCERWSFPGARLLQFVPRVPREQSSMRCGHVKTTSIASERESRPWDVPASACPKEKDFRRRHYYSSLIKTGPRDTLLGSRRACYATHHDQPFVGRTPQQPVPADDDYDDY